MKNAIELMRETVKEYDVLLINYIDLCKYDYFKDYATVKRILIREFPDFDFNNSNLKHEVFNNRFAINYITDTLYLRSSGILILNEHNLFEIVKSYPNSNELETFDISKYNPHKSHCL